MKTKIKLILALIGSSILLLGFSNCGGARLDKEKIDFEQNPPFNISEAYYQKWVAGTEEGGAGINIYVLFAEMQPNVVIQNIYFRNHKLEAKGNRNDPNKFVGSILAEEQRDIIMHHDPLLETRNTPELFPFKLGKHEAVLEYWYGGRRNFYKISGLSQKELISYPQANPNFHE